MTTTCWKVLVSVLSHAYSSNYRMVIDIGTYVYQQTQTFHEWVETVLDWHCQSQGKRRFPLIVFWVYGDIWLCSQKSQGSIQTSFRCEV